MGHYHRSAVDDYNRLREEGRSSGSELCKILKDEYGMDTHRTTIKTDVEMLQNAGFGIQTTRSTQNRYNYIEREFDDAELKLLIDAVESAKFITKAKGDQLVAKLTELAGMHKARELKRNLVVDGRYKTGSDQIYYIVDAINQAINLKKKIRFQMCEFNIKKEKVLHNGGERYTFSPYSLVWDGDFYYVMGYSEKYKRIGSHRVDRIADIPEILDEPAVPAGPFFDPNKYINTMFRMFIDTEAMERDRKLLGAMLEVRKKYGANAIFKGMNLMEGATTLERNQQIGGHKSAFDSGQG